MASEIDRATGPTGTSGIGARPSARISLAVLFLAALGAAVAIGFDRWHRGVATAVIAGIEASGRQKLGEISDDSAEGLVSARATLQLIALSPPVRGVARALEGGGYDAQDGSSLSQWLDRMGQIGSAIIGVDPRIGQFRLIGMADGGREILRVTRDRARGIPVIAETADLQRMGDRDYFTRALALGPGESLIDGPSLNIEGGRMETPPRPTVLMAVPARDDRGTPFGVLVLNLDADRVLLDLLGVVATNPDVVLLDGTGVILAMRGIDLAASLSAGSGARTWGDDFAPLDAGKPDGLSRVTEAFGLRTFRRRTTGEIVDTLDLPFGLRSPQPIFLRRILPRSETAAAIREAVTLRLVPIGAIGLLGLGAALLLVVRGGRERARNERLLRSLTDGAPAAIMLIDREMRYRFVNRVFARTVGRAVPDIIGRRIDEVQPAKVLDVVRPMLERALAGEQLSFDQAFDMPGGSTRWLNSRYRPERTATGELIGVVAVVQDVTDRVSLARMLGARNDDLARMVHERTAELEEAMTAAMSANRIKTDFLARMSHEIRTPMNAIVGMSELLTRTPLDGRQSELVDHVRRSSRDLLRIVNDLLDFSQLEAGKLGIEKEAFAVAPLVEDIVGLLAPSSTPHHPTLRAEIDPLVPARVRGDRGRLRQILMNLVGNALKFTPDGEIVVRVGPGARTGRVRFEVTDTGTGIPPEHQGRLFQPFEQVGDSRVSPTRGTGLGLAICRELVDLMGGEIGLRSTVGQGSTFWFELPLPRVTDPTGRQPRILLARSSSVAARLTGLLLERCGCIVEHASTGAEALARCTTADFDALLCDPLLDDMSGADLAAAVRTALAGTPASGRPVPGLYVFEGPGTAAVTGVFDGTVPRGARTTDLARVLGVPPPAHVPAGPAATA